MPANIIEKRVQSRQGQQPAVECVICGATDNRHVFMLDPYAVKSCVSCGLQFLSPQPSDAELAKIYGKNYFFTQDVGEEEQSSLKRATSRLYLDQIAAVRGTNKTGSLLEIGCGNGYLLLEAMSAGYKAAGIEYSQAAVDAANARLGGPFVQVGSIDSVDLKADQFDVIIACDVIEHVRDPRVFLQAVYRALAPGGVFYCVTPSLASFSAKLMGNNWVEYKHEHLYYFAPDNISQLFAGSGFRSIRELKNYKILSPRYVATHFKRFPKPGWTPAAAVIEKLMPNWLLDARIRIVASGMAICAKK